MRFFQVGPWDQHSGVRGNVAKGMVDLVMCIMLRVVSETLEPKFHGHCIAASAGKPSPASVTRVIHRQHSIPIELIGNTTTRFMLYPFLERS